MVCTVLYVAVAVVPHWPGAVAVDGGRRRAGGQRAQEALRTARRALAALGAAGGAVRRDDGHDLVAAGLPARPVAGVVLHVARRAAAQGLFSKVHPDFPHAGVFHLGGGICGRHSSGLFDIGTLADLSNIGTLFAFVLVSIGVIVLRIAKPERRRGFRVPFGPVIPVLSVIFCFLLMAGLPIITWWRFCHLAGDRAGDLLPLQPAPERVFGKERDRRERGQQVMR